LDAVLQVKSATGERIIEAEDFFITYMTTSLESDEVLASILFKEPPKNSGWGIHEVARRDGDFAMVGSAAVMALDSSNTCTYVRIVLFGVAATPVRATEVEAELLGSTMSSEVIEAAAIHVREVVDAESDVHASAEYRGNVARVLAVRALNDAAKRATTAN
jgi:CO/xanthine dehydrogenase FAD-binding subunit